MIMKRVENFYNNNIFKNKFNDDVKWTINQLLEEKKW